MFDMELMLDILLIALLTATLFHAVRLERALGVLKRDRSALESLVASFNASTQAAETGIERLHAATEGAGRQIQRQIDTATPLKDDLTFLVQRGEGLADRLEELVSAARPVLAATGELAARQAYPGQFPSPRPAPTRLAPVQAATRQAASGQTAPPIERTSSGAEPIVRSQAERDLLKALRMVR